MTRRLMLLSLLVFVLTSAAPQVEAGCAGELVMVSPTGCTAVYCDLQAEVRELDGSGRYRCYYGNCSIVSVDSLGCKQRV